MRILVVENSSDQANEICTVLKGSGHTVVCSNDVKQAMVEYGKGDKFSLVISDLSFPDLDGFHLLQFLRAHTAKYPVPVMVVTDVTDKESVLKCKQLGAKDYIVKPIEPEQLIKRISLVMKHRRASVLIVDDDQLILQLLGRVLERKGYRVATATSAELALETIEQDNVALVISDLEMPGMDGLELLTTIQEKHPRLPVLIVTGRGSKYSKEFILQAGARGYINKPFKNFEIIEAVTAGLNQAQTTSP